MKSDIRFIANRPLPYPALFRGNTTGDTYLFTSPDVGFRIAHGVNNPRKDQCPIGASAPASRECTRLTADQELVLRNET